MNLVLIFLGILMGYYCIFLLVGIYSLIKNVGIHIHRGERPGKENWLIYRNTLDWFPCIPGPLRNMVYPTDEDLKRMGY